MGEDGVGGALQRRDADRERFQSFGGDPMRLREPDPRQRLTRPRTLVEGEASDRRDRRPHEELDAPNRPLRRDGEAGENFVAERGPPQIFDRGDQGHVEVAGPEPVREPTRMVELQTDRGGRLGQPLVEWAGIEVSHGPDANWSPHRRPPRPTPKASASRLSENTESSLGGSPRFFKAGVWRSMNLGVAPDSGDGT